MSLEIQVNINTEKFDEMMKMLNREMKRKDYLDSIGNKMLFLINKQFKTEGRVFTLTGWKPLRPLTLMARRGGGQGANILRDTGRLAQSFVKQVSIYNNWVAVGTEDIKGLWHHEGRPNIYPKGQYLRVPLASGSYRLLKKAGYPARRILPDQKMGERIAFVELQFFAQKLVKKYG